MIKVGIIGCGNLRAAELVRILINHPDVELKWVCDGGCRGMRLDQVVPGIVGESDLVVSARGECADEVSVIFMCDRRSVVTAQLQGFVLSDDLHVIDLSGSHNLDHGPDKPWAYGMSEMQRRMLVHDTRQVTVPRRMGGM